MVIIIWVDMPYQEKDIQAAHIKKWFLNACHDKKTFIQIAVMIVYKIIKISLWTDLLEALQWKDGLKRMIPQQV